MKKRFGEGRIALARHYRRRQTIVGKLQLSQTRAGAGRQQAYIVQDMDQRDRHPLAGRGGRNNRVVRSHPLSRDRRRREISARTTRQDIAELLRKTIRRIQAGTGRRSPLREPVKVWQGGADP